MKTFNVNEYIRQKYKQIVLKLDRQKDAKIIQHLEDQRNVTAYVRYLISKDLITEETHNGEEAEQV